MQVKKLALASAMALMFAGAAQAADIEIITPSTENLAEVSAAVGDLLSVAAPDISIMNGAINTAVLNGAIDITGINVTLSSLANNVSATATATAATSTADAYAIAGVKLGTTVIGALNSSTLELATRVVEQGEKTATQLNVGSLASQGGNVNLTGQSLDGAGFGDLTGISGFNGISTTGSDILTGVNGDSTDLQLSLSDLVSSTSSELVNKVTDLQQMNLFNTAINTATLDAGIRVAAIVDENAWFLNPQTGVVNLSNVAMATTVIGALNSSTTRLGANLSPTVTVK
jgi:hypothetical protein